MVTPAQGGSGPLGCPFLFFFPAGEEPRSRGLLPGGVWPLVRPKLPHSNALSSPSRARINWYTRAGPAPLLLARPHALSWSAAKWPRSFFWAQAPSAVTRL
jgi:hypothetical protein